LIEEKEGSPGGSPSFCKNSGPPEQKEEGLQAVEEPFWVRPGWGPFSALQKWRATGWLSQGGCWHWHGRCSARGRGHCANQLPGRAGLEFQQQRCAGELRLRKLAFDFGSAAKRKLTSDTLAHRLALPKYSMARLIGIGSG
jgi:hypothetical protein